MNSTREADALVIGGLERFSTVDWPGMMTATVFCQGCGWRCRFCHNADLIPFASEAGGGSPAREGARGDPWTWPSVRGWLRDRRGLLDGVVFSGGEPTFQRGLAAAMRDVRELGFKVGLHTGGPLPAALASVLPLVDWVGFDFKAPFNGYSRVTGRDAGEAARASLAMLLRAGVAHEVRTTWHPHLLPDDDLHTMADTLAEVGVESWVVQRFRPEGCRDAELRAAPVGDPPAAALARPGLRVRTR